jgi:hypothetical protein
MIAVVTLGANCSIGGHSPLSKAWLLFIRPEAVLAGTRQTPMQDAAFFVALFATSVALAGALAHAFEFPHKITMSVDDYFVVQRIYAGWNRLGYVLAVQLVGIVWLIALYRGRPRVLALVVIALTALAAAQELFWIFTFPANQATANWTLKPPDWDTLRKQWEYSHLGGAAFQTIAMAALIAAVLRRQ